MGRKQVNEVIKEIIGRASLYLLPKGISIRESTTLTSNSPLFFYRHNKR